MYRSHQTISMDSEQTFEFIALLEDHPALWKKEDKDFINREVRKRLLSQIADRIGITEDDCRRKLKNLKDKMRGVCSKLPKTASGQPAFHKCEKFVRWPYYKAMLFMKDQFMNRDANGDLLGEGGGGNDDDDDEEEEGGENVELLPSTSTITFNLNDHGNDRHLAASASQPSSVKKESVDHNGNGNSGKSTTINQNAQQASLRTLRMLRKVATSKRVLPVNKKSLAGRTRKRRASGATAHHDGGAVVDVNVSTNGVGVATETFASPHPHPLAGSVSADEWTAFAESICHDLRKISNPFLVVSVKNDINRLVGETVIKQLNMNSACVDVATPLGNGMATRGAIMPRADGGGGGGNVAGDDSLAGLPTVQIQQLPSTPTSVGDVMRLKTDNSLS